MKHPFRSRPFLVKILGAIGLCILVVTLLEWVLLSRHLPADQGRRLTAAVELLGLNSALFAAIALVLRQAYIASIQRPLHGIASLLQQPQAPPRPAPPLSEDENVSQEVRALAQTAHAARSALRALFAAMQEQAQSVLESARVLASGSQAQLSRIEFQQPSQDDMRQMIHEFTDTAKYVSHTVRQMAEHLEALMRAARREDESRQTLRATIETIQRSSQLSAEKITALDKQTGHIHDVVATIDGIIEDTKLIAFNATIESARAKDEGRGFSVVALEIKRLAEEVFESTEEIKEFIQEVQLTSHALMASTAAELDSIHTGRALIEESDVALQHILAQIRQAAEAARHMTAETEQQTEAGDHMLHLTHSVIRSSEHLNREIRAFAVTSERLQQQAEALEQRLRNPFSG